MWVNRLSHTELNMGYGLDTSVGKYTKVLMGVTYDIPSPILDMQKGDFWCLTRACESKS